MKLNLIEQIKLGEIIGGTVQFTVMELNSGNHEDCAQICSLLAGFFADKAKVERNKNTPKDVAMGTGANNAPHTSEQQTKD
ncbi:TPA: hypothetical protein PXP51_001548 [Yersinia enterocolitica]|nr:hypothetical protein [Yersinia enterocolitica]HEN3478645.1 hypothetical protein [Yersinia enterocolitica]